MEVHHIKQRSEGGADTLDNAISLCFDCHGDMRSYDHNHPKGLKYTRNELVRRRDEWYAIVKQKGKTSKNESVSETDKTVFHHLTKILPWNGSILFIRDNNFAGFSFDSNRLNDLYFFKDACSNPSFKFEDSVLEQERSTLLLHLNDFVRAIGRYTFRVNNTESHSSVLQEWEFSQPEQFEIAVNAIHQAATAAYAAYERLVSGGKTKLGIVSFA